VQFGFQASNIAIVPNAVNSAVYAPADQPAPPGPLIGHLGRLKKYKSTDHLLQAFQIVRQEVPEARLKIIGDGDYRPELEKLSRELGVGEQVEFTGYLSQSEKVRQLHQMRVAVNCSAKEGWGLTVIEANACGVPVIASDVPGLKDSVVDEKTGLLFEYGNVEQLAQKILLMLRDDNLHARLRSEAITWGQGFNWDESARKMLEVLERAVARKSNN
jgi:glycosyltransferase involved in cell wall biosynthesis